MRVEPIVSEALPQTISEPTQWSPELGLGTAASNATDVIDALTVGGLLDLIPGSEPRYVGANGFETPVRAEEPVVDVVGVDRKLFDAANAAKARTHILRGMPGSLQQDSSNIASIPEKFCCVFPWAAHMLMVSPCILCGIFENICNRHEDMEFPSWAGAALVMTDKGVIGRRHFGNQTDVNAISWGGFDVDRNVRIRPYDARCTSPCDPISNSWDPLVVGPYFGLLVPCCRCICIQPKEPGLYRATIFSKHTTTVSTGGQGGSVEIPTGSIDLLALARSPDDLRSALRAAKEKYLESLPTTTVAHDFGVARLLGIYTWDTGRAEVVAVKRCSKAESYGMQVGDTILELDGHIVDADAFNAGMAAARRAKRTVRLLIARASPDITGEDASEG